MAVKLWDRDKGDEVDRLSGYGAMLSPDGAILASHRRMAEIELWDLSGRTFVKSLPVAHGLQDGAFSHDGTKLATAHAAGRLVQCWEILSGRLLHEFRGHTDGVFAVVFSLDDQSIISAGADATIRFWSVADRMQNGLHLGHAGRIWNLALSPDGRQIASAGSDGTVKLWDAILSRDFTKVPIDAPCYVGFQARRPDLNDPGIGTIMVHRALGCAIGLVTEIENDRPTRTKNHSVVVSFQ